MLTRPFMWGYFSYDTTHIFLIKSYWFYFHFEEIFAKNAILEKTRKLLPRKNFHVDYNTEPEMP